MPKEPTSEPAVSCSPGQLEDLIAFVQPDDLPTLASNYKSSPEKFGRQLAGYIVLSACRGLTPAQISRSLDSQEIRIHRDNISFLLSTWNDLQWISSEELRARKQRGEDEDEPCEHSEQDDSDIAIRLELTDKPSCTRLDLKRQEDYWRFVNLNGDEDVFDIEKARDLADERYKTVRAVPPDVDRGNQFLYETEDGRFVLVFTSANCDATPPSCLDRELSPQEASLWFILQDLPLPEPLKPVPVRELSKDPSSRLNPGWKPFNGRLLPKDATKEERTQSVKEYLAQHPSATSEQVSRATGIPEGTVRNHPVWKTRGHKQEAAKPERSSSGKERPLTRKMVQAIADPRQVDPASEAEENDLWDFIQRHFLENADNRDKANYHRLPKDEKRQELCVYALQNGLEVPKE